MPNIKKYKERVSYSFNTDRELITKIQQTAKRRGITTSEYITNLMREDLQKNEIGGANPLNISYYKDGYNNVPRPNISLDRYMKTPEVKTAMEIIPKPSLNFAYSNYRKATQQLQYRLEGKITL